MDHRKHRQTTGAVVGFGTHIPELQLDDDVVTTAFEAAQLQPGEIMIELGSGHGTGLVTAARDFGAVARGIEYLPSAAARAKRLARRENVDISVEIGDVMQANVAAADVVLLHLGPAFHDIICDRLEAMLQPHARVIAAGWQVPGWISTSSDDDFEYGYIYRPSDPQWQATISKLHPDNTDCRILRCISAIDMTQIEVKTDGSLPTKLSSNDCARGQSILLEIASDATYAELWARSTNGRRCIRGPMFKIR